MLTRRQSLQLLALAGALLPSRGLAQADAPAPSPAPSAAPAAPAVDIPAPVIGRGPARPFSHDTVVTLARELAAKPYAEPPTAPQPWADLTYDQYKNILFDARSALWFDEGLPFQSRLFSPGLYFTQAIDIAVVENGEAQPLIYDSRVFTRTDQVPPLPEDPGLGFTGFNLLHPINKVWQMEEFAVFQGASYFRAVGEGQVYGLSARGLAIRTGDPRGEEFPFFRAFWLERPDEHARAVTVHALLDSQSVAGAYRFTIEPGATTIMDVDAQLFPRVPLDHAGIAPGTSMFLFDETNRERFDDFRPAVFDSDGLLIRNGAGEMLWRKLANPVSLQVSSFVDENPQGFGLMQRARDPDDFADLEALYERRPSLWVEPLHDWGQGAVQLTEIPANREIFDNIVVYWRPREPLEPRAEGHRYRYRLHWGDDPAIATARARVTDTHLGGQPFDERGGGRHVAIDFGPHHLIHPDLRKVSVHVSSDKLAGDRLGKPILKRNPNTGGVRVDFIFYPEDATSVELRAQLNVDDRPISEVWLYRWTK